MSPGQDLKIRYVAEIQPVREITLHGFADANFWRQQLLTIGEEPLIVDGRVPTMLTAAEMKFAGLRFRELSVLVQLERGADQSERVFMPAAFNTIRFFAWMERWWFQTPYVHSAVEVRLKPSVRCAIPGRSRPLLLAEMHSAAGDQPRPTEGCLAECWEGRVLLPTRSAGSSLPPNWFYAKLTGETQRYPFLPSDVFALQPTPEFPVLQDLRDSNFQPQTWSVRPNAFHAKSKTYAGSVRAD